MRIILFLILLLSGMLLFTSCRQRQGKSGGSTGSSVSSVVLVLFDISGSTGSKSVRAQYLKDFQTVVSQLSAGDTIIGEVITDNTLARARLPIQETLPVFNAFRDNKITYDESAKKTVEHIHAQAKETIEKTNPVAKTDLMNAFQFADKILNGEEYAKTNEKILVIFSDMIEQSDHYNFADIKLADTQDMKIINAEKSAGRLPRLTGVKVWIAGATNMPTPLITSDKIQEIEAFWQKYFEVCGAELPKEHYASVLLGFTMQHGKRQ